MAKAPPPPLARTLPLPEMQIGALRVLATAECLPSFKQPASSVSRTIRRMQRRASKPLCIKEMPVTGLAKVSAVHDKRAIRRQCDNHDKWDQAR